MFDEVLSITHARMNDDGKPGREAFGDRGLAFDTELLEGGDATGSLIVEPRDAGLPREAFETNRNLHYPTNANPILLPDPSAATALNACLWWMPARARPKGDADQEWTLQAGEGA